MRLATLSATLLALAILLSVTANPAGACTRILIPFVRTNSPGLVVTPLADTVAVGPVSWRATLPPPRRGVADSTRVVYGQSLRVQLVTPGVDHLSRVGAEEARVSASLGRIKSAILVTWSSSSDCRRHPAPWSARFLTPGSEVFLALPVRAESLWVNGVPVIDELGSSFGALYSPTRAMRVPYYSSGTRSDRERALSAREFASFYAAMPTYCDWARYPQKSATALEAWVRARPRLRDRYPVPEILRAMREEAASVRRDPQPVPEYCTKADRPEASAPN